MALFCDGANGVAVAAAVAAPAGVGAVEEEDVRVVAVVLVQRARPVAVRATVVDLRADAVARSGEKDRITIRSGNFLPFNTINLCPLPRTLVTELLDFIKRGHTPTTTPLHVGYIVGGTADVGTDIYYPIEITITIQIT